MTVVTVVRDHAIALSETIWSVKCQTLADWEYVIVDATSDDELSGTISRFERSDPRVTSVRLADPAELAVWSGDGLTETRGRYVAWIAAGDVAMSDRLERQVALVERERTVHVCVGESRQIDELGSLEARAERVPAPGVLRWSVCLGAGVASSTLCADRIALTETMRGVEPDLASLCLVLRREWLAVIRDSVVFCRRRELLEASNPDDARTVEVLREHLRELAGEEWTAADVRALRGARSFDLDDRLEAMDRWQRLWRRDTHLSPADRAALRTLGIRARVKQISTDARLPSLSSARAVARSWRRRI